MCRFLFPEEMIGRYQAIADDFEIVGSHFTRQNSIAQFDEMSRIDLEVTDHFVYVMSKHVVRCLNDRSGKILSKPRRVYLTQEIISQNRFVHFGQRRQRTSELTGRRDFTQPSPDQLSGERGSSRSGPTSCWIAPSELVFKAFDSRLQIFDLCRETITGRAATHFQQDRQRLTV
jgi:hypothetical protein